MRESLLNAMSPFGRKTHSRKASGGAVGGAAAGTPSKGTKKPVGKLGSLGSLASSPAAPLPKHQVTGKRASRTGVGRSGGGYMRDAGNTSPGMNGFLDTMNPAAASKSKAAGAGPASKREPAALSPLVVVLDMDECLVHTQRFVDNVGAVPGRNGAQASSNYRQAEARPELSPAMSGKCRTVQVPIEDGGTACVNLRPGLNNFLEVLAADPMIEVHIFTAALPLYARPVLNAIDPKGNLIQSRFYRKSCVIRNGIHGKDLQVIPGWTPERTLLVDNNPVSFLPNPKNGLLVTSWHNDHADTQLAEALALLQKLKTEKDVRPMLDAFCGARVRAATKRYVGLWTRDTGHQGHM